MAILSDNPNIYVISVLTSVDCLFPGELRFSSFFICQVILDVIVDILNIYYETAGLIEILWRRLTFLFWQAID